MRVADRIVGACPLTAVRNDWRSSVYAVTAVVATAVAVRGVERSSAISPIPSPRPNVRTCCPARVISTLPSTST